MQYEKGAKQAFSIHGINVNPLLPVFPVQNIRVFLQKKMQKLIFMVPLNLPAPHFQKTTHLLTDLLILQPEHMVMVVSLLQMEKKSFCREMGMIRKWHP